MEKYKGKWLKEPENILFSVEDAVARITLNIPEKRNALDHVTLGEVRSAMFEADDRRDINVIILEGAGKDFCAGFNLVTSYAGRGEQTCVGIYRYREATENFDDDAWSMERIHDTTLMPFAIHKPVIAKIQGNCCE